MKKAGVWARQSDRGVWPGWMPYALLLIQVIVWRLPLFGHYLRSTPASFGYVSRQILRGGVPYRDYFETAAPGIYYLGAFFKLFTGQIAQAYWLMELAASAGIVLLVYWLCRRVAGAWASFLCATLALLLMNVSIYYYFCSGYFEFEALFFLTAALALTLADRRPGFHMLAGAACLLAILTHPLVLSLCLPLWGWMGLTRRWRQLSLHWTALAGSLLLFVLWFLALGALGDLLYHVVLYNWIDLIEITRNFNADQLPFVLYLVAPLPLLLYLIPAGFLRSGERETRNEFLLMLGWLGLTLVVLFAYSSRLFVHHLVYLSAPTAVTLGYAWAAYWRGSRSVGSGFAAASLVSGLLLLLLFPPPAMRYYGLIEQAREAGSPETFLSRSPDVEEFLRQYDFGERPAMILPLVQGAEAPEMALRSETRLPAFFVIAHNWFSVEHPRRRMLIERFEQALQSQPSPLLILPKDPDRRLRLPDSITAWIDTHYQPLRDFYFYQVLEYSAPEPPEPAMP